MLPRPTCAASLFVVALLVLSGCGHGDGWPDRDAEPQAVGSLAPGFLPSATPSPEATITPAPGSWDDVHPSKGYRVVLLTTDEDRATRTLTSAVESWADDEDVALRIVRADKPREYLDRITDALDRRPDLIVSAGNGLIDPLTAVTANHLDQPFLVLGAELAEPTHNVTAAEWPGASYRGEGLQTSSGYDPSTFTAERAGRALRAGVASVISGQTGIVLMLS